MCMAVRQLSGCGLVALRSIFLCLLSWVAVHSSSRCCAVSLGFAHLHLLSMPVDAFHDG